MNKLPAIRQWGTLRFVTAGALTLLHQYVASLWGQCEVPKIFGVGAVLQSIHLSLYSIDTSQCRILADGGWHYFFCHHAVLVLFHWLIIDWLFLWGNRQNHNAGRILGRHVVYKDKGSRRPAVSSDFRSVRFHHWHGPNPMKSMKVVDIRARMFHCFFENIAR